MNLTNLLEVGVYLGSLAAISSPNLPSAAGAVLAYIAIFSPGLLIHTGTVGLWKALRRYKWISSGLRGIHATAIGLIYTAVYRLWQLGYIDQTNQNGTSLDVDPGWIVITATSFIGGMYFDLAAPVAIILGGVMGMIWFAVVTT